MRMALVGEDGKGAARQGCIHIEYAQTGMRSSSAYEQRKVRFAARFTDGKWAERLSNVDGDNRTSPASITCRKRTLVFGINI